MGDAQRLLRIDKEAPLKDQKIALLEPQVSNLGDSYCFVQLRYALCSMHYATI